ncbi:MAG: FAD-dependent oxidoreductase, partial [Acidimicrobiales bacterium]
MPGGADYDLVVIGGGAGGLSAARAGVRRQARTALVADAPLGGECTFTGCIPSKTLIEAAASGESFETAMARVRSTVAAVAATETAEVLRAEGVEVIEATARFDGPRSVRADGRVLR